MQWQLSIANNLVSQLRNCCGPLATLATEELLSYSPGRPLPTSQVGPQSSRCLSWRPQHDFGSRGQLATGPIFPVGFTVSLHAPSSGVGVLPPWAPAKVCNATCVSIAAPSPRRQSCRCTEEDVSPSDGLPMGTWPADHGASFALRRIGSSAADAGRCAETHHRH